MKNNNKNNRNSLQNKINFHNNLKSISEFKIVILGDLAVGKSSIANRYIQNIFSDKYVATIGASFYTKNIKLSNNELIKIHIWETEAQKVLEQFLIYIIKEQIVLY